MKPPTVFQTASYLAAYRRVFGAGKGFHRLHSPGGEVWLQTRGKAARRVEFWGSGVADVGGVALANPEAAPALWQTISTFAATRDGASLPQLPADSPLVPLATSSGWTVTPAETCPILALPESMEAYTKSLGKNMREQMRRYPRRLEKEFQVEYELAATTDQVEVALEDLFRLHAKRWHRRGQPGVLALPSRKRFHRLVCQSLLKRNRLRLWTLRLNGEAACVLLNYAYEGTYSFFIGGFEPDLMRWSVGTCLFARVFETAIGEGAHTFDFLRGEEEYKYRYGAVDRAYVDLSWFAPTPRGALLRKRVELEREFMRRLHERYSAANAGPAKTEN